MKEQRDAAQYTWAEVTGLLTIMATISGKALRRHVEITNEAGARNGYGFQVFGSYGTRLDYISEAVEMDDGSILMCVTTSTFMDTDASNERAVKYYHLTPRS